MMVNILRRLFAGAPVAIWLVALHLGLLSSTSSVAQLATPASIDLRSKASLEVLARHPQWLALLHYGKRRNAGYRNASYIDDPAFFLAEDGPRNPHSELLASIERLASTPALRCRFVARTSWLQEQGLLEAGITSHCPDYERWRSQIDAGSIALVFAASYLNSPSSMYGHTFLRVDPAGDRAESALLSHAINYAAHVPPNDNSLLFAWRGMTGGYRGLFSLQSYVEKLQEYSRLENRDIWEYELSLSDDELERLMAHVWELRDINIDYYFMDENCSFRLLELLEVARPSLNLTSGFSLHAIPVDTVRSVQAANLVSDVTYRPSRQNELSSLLDDLGQAEQTLVLRLADNPALAESAEFSLHAPERQYRMVLAAYRLLRYRYNREARDEGVAAKSFALLRSLNAFPRGVAGLSPVPLPERPDRGHGTAQWGLARGESVRGGAAHQGYSELDVRLTYHDLLDPVSAYPEAASLNMLRAVVRKTDGGSTRLQSLDILDIRSLAARDRFFRPVSWQAKAGAERPLVGDDRLSSFAQGGAGGSWRLLGATASLLATARLEYSEVFQDNWQFAPGLAARFGWQFEGFAASVEGQHYRFINGVDRNQASVRIQRSLSVNQGLRLSWTRQLQDSRAGEEVSLQWRHYF
ncbi:MAG TPA: hypothetical protein DIW43_07630 [Spongiibacteraceae bacterium]|nr:hypothetical protein [Spongiibacteraceae bacterium]